jgi:PAS domain S-box-containing protein
MDNSLSQFIKDEERFEALFQYASLGILVVNQAGEIIMANNFLLSLFGYENAKELVGQKIEKLIPGRFHHRHVAYREGYTENPQKRPMGVGLDLFASRKDGSEFPIEVSLSNYQNNEGKFTIAFVSDISKRKEIENAVLYQKQELAKINLKIEELNNDLEQKVDLRTRQLQETLAQLEKSKEELTLALSQEKDLSDLKSRFVSMASHEFRTPLSTILSSASLVAKYKEADEQEKRDKHIQRIKSAVHNLTDILNEFLSIGKIEDGKIQPNYSRFNMPELINSICNDLQGICKKGQKIKYLHEGKTEVELDITLMRNVFINLLSNAIKFSPENSGINLLTKVDAREVFILIADAGIGISEDDQQHLFERFFRGKNVTNINGTGLGLHIVSKYVELMDGRIECTSELEKGTTFTITFQKIN